MLYKKLLWYERALAINKFHKEKLKADIRWSYRQTAAELNVSVGTVCNDINIASWLKTHPDLIDFKTAKEALEFIKTKKLKLRLQ